MKRLHSKKDLKGYTLMLNVLTNLELVDKDYVWLISDIEAYPTNEKYSDLINNNEYLLLTTKELVDMLKVDDFQWIWAVFSAISPKYSKDEILKYNLPLIQSTTSTYNSILGKPQIQHPLAEFEICAWDSSGMFLVTNDENLLSRFKKHYPLSIDDFDKNVVFDDWQYRDKTVIKQIKQDYGLLFVLLGIFTLITIVVMFFSLYALLFFILAVIADICILFSYLKIMNNHLVITTEAIYITNLFKKEKEYIIDYKSLSLEIKQSVKRGGGLWLKFFKDDKLLLKYEDMLNFPIGCGDKLTDWGIAIKALKIPIKDRNRFYDQ